AHRLRWRRAAVSRRGATAASRSARAVLHREFGEDADHGRRLRGRMIRPHLLAWQWSDYAAKHGNRTNLLLHVPAVALFWVGTIAFVCGVTRRSIGEIAIALGCLIVSVAAQGRGHRLAREAPTTIRGAGGF